MLEQKINICVMVSGGGTNLQALLDAEKNGSIKSGKISMVVSNNPKAYALKRAENSKIENLVYENEDELMGILRRKNIKLVILAGFLKILSPKFIREFKGKIINVHPSLIPSFCGKGCYGLHVHEKALAYGVKVTGATIHFVNEIPDGGKIISQKAVEIMEDDTPEILQRRVMEEAEWILLPKAAEEISMKLMKGIL